MIPRTAAEVVEHPDFFPNPVASLVRNLALLFPLVGAVSFGIVALVSVRVAKGLRTHG